MITLIAIINNYGNSAVMEVEGKPRPKEQQRAVINSERLSKCFIRSFLTET